MIELLKHIETLLQENDCVIIPDFGGFVVHYAPASYVKEDCIFLPPSRIIAFNPLLKLNDGLLVQSYMALHHINFAEATQRVKKGTSELIRLLHENGKVSIENIGDLRCNIRGNYEFKPDDFKIAAPSLYGLDSFEIKELADLLPQKQPEWKPVISTQIKDDESKKKNVEFRIHRGVIRHAVAAVVAVLLFFICSTPLKNTYIHQNNYAQLLPSDWWQQLEKQSIVMTPVTFESAGNQNRMPAKQIKTSKPIITKEIKVGHAEKTTQTATPTPQKDTYISQQATPAKPAAMNSLPSKSTSTGKVIGTTSNKNGKYHIIVAGGISIKDAEIMVSRLKKEGYTSACVLSGEGKVRVSIFSFDKREEATQRMLKLREIETYKNAWLLAK